MIKLSHGVKVNIGMSLIVLAIILIVFILTKGIVFSPAVWNYVFLVLGFGMIIGGFDLIGSKEKEK
jgi:hypothetical protein